MNEAELTLSMAAAIASLVGAVVGAFLLHFVVVWWDGRHDRRLKAEVESYNRGYKWASEALASGELPPVVIEQLTMSWPGETSTNLAFDRGADAAVTDYHMRNK